MPELSNPVFPALAQAIETALADRGFTPLLCTQTPGGTTEDQYVEVLLEHSVDGIVFVSGLHADTTAHRERYHRLRSRGNRVQPLDGVLQADGELGEQRRHAIVGNPAGVLRAQRERHERAHHQLGR